MTKPDQAGKPYSFAQRPAVFRLYIYLEDIRKSRKLLERSGYFSQFRKGGNKKGTKRGQANYAVS